MANFVNFDAKFKFVNLKSGFFLFSELKDMLTEKWKNANSIDANQWATRASLLDSEFIAMVVSTVRETNFTTHQPTCNISLQTLTPLPLDSCPSPQAKHLSIIAQILYRSYGIEIQQVNDMESPQTMAVTWQRDHLWLHPPSPYLVQSRKEGFRTDCTLKFGEKLYPVHGTVLAAKSSYFETMFKSKHKEAEFGVTIPIIMEGVEEKSVEMLLDYFYTGELDLKDASMARIDNLVNFSSYFALPHLEQICFEHLCKTVNANNLLEYVLLARNYSHEELEAALVRHIGKEITLDIFAQLIHLGKRENIEGLMLSCTEGIMELIDKIDYEPWGFGKSTQLKYFVSLLDAIIETRSFQMLPPLIAKMREVLSHPGYGAHLEKRIEYLALICKYETRFEGLPDSVSKMKEELYQKVLASITLRGTSLYKGQFNWSLTEECLEVAQKYQFEEIKKLSTGVLITKFQEDLGNNQNLNLEPYLQIAQKYNIPALTKICEILTSTKQDGS